MNPRKVLCVVCVLVVGLLLVLESPALAGPWRVEYWLGERPVYGANGNPLVPKVSVPLYRAEDTRLPSFLRSRTRTAVSVPSVGVWDDDGVPNNRVAPQPWGPFEWSDPAQPGGWDSWDPLGNSFGFAK